MKDPLVRCNRCDKEIQTFSPMRKWCIDCRRVISLERAKSRKLK